jgi:putative membrane protein
VPGMGAMRALRFTLHNALTQWNFGPFGDVVLVALVAAAIWYLRADWLLARRGRRWSTWRLLSFLAGLVAVDLAFQSSIADLAGSYFQAHVCQHLLLMAVAPPLLALGAPSTLLLQTASRTSKTRWLRVLRSGPFAVISHPITVWFLYYGAMFVFFLTSLVNVAMWHMDLMDGVNVVFLLGGMLFWWPMVGLDPIIHWKIGYAARMLTILFGAGMEAFLGVALMNNAHPAASMYTLASTHAGGALLWVSTELVTVGAFIPIYVQWTRSEDRAAARADARLQVATATVAESADHPPTASRPLSLWEAEWLRRRGAAPQRAEAPGDTGIFSDA